MKNARRKYRLAMLDDLTLRELFHFRVSLLGVISFFTLSLLAQIVLLSVLIIYTPIRNVLPGYSESLRQQLIQESARVDSLQTSLTVQRQYLDVIKQLTAGDIRSDSVQSLDSLERIERTRILDQRSEAIDAFTSQYEQKEKDRLTIFENTANRNVRQFYRPVRGAVMQSARPDKHIYGTAIRTAKNESVLAVARGTVVSAERMADNSFTLVLQSGNVTAVYRHLAKILKQQGSSVEAGEVLAIADNEKDLVFELWEAGAFVNFEEVIVW